MGNFKAVRYGLDQPVELYDLTLDIGERSDVSASHPDKIAEVNKLFATNRTDSIRFPYGGGKAFDPDEQIVVVSP